MVDVGVDLHKRVSQVAVLTANGTLSQHRLENEGRRIEQFFTTLPSPARVAIEASGTWWWLVDLLQRLGHQPVLSNPKQTKAIAAARLKNDRVDAERLVLLLRGGLLPTVWIPPADVREARELLRHRVRLVWIRTGIKNQVQALLARRNLQPASGRSWMTARGQRELAALPLGTIPCTIQANCQALLGLLDEQIRHLDQALLARWGEDPRVRRLMTIPGIGPFIAILLVVELGEIHRFPSAKHVASYTGLVPRVRATGEYIRLGHISKEGNRLLRWALVLAATQAARRPGPLRAWFRIIQHRKGTKAARVALARRLAELVYQIWKEEGDYFALLRRSAVQG
jgi:transposase